MFVSHKLMNLLRSSIQILNSGSVSSAKLHSAKIPLCYTLARQDFLFFKRGVSQLTQENESSSGTKFVQMRGLPFEATVADVVKFFKPLQIEPVEVTIKTDRNGRPTGFAVVKFESSDDAVKALRNHQSHIGRRYIELSLNTRPEYISPRRYAPQPFVSDLPTKGHRVVLKGLPYAATPDDVVQFFAPLNIKPSSVKMRLNYSNLPSGMCDCIFDTHEDAVTALRNHRVYIGSRYIEVTLAPNFKPE